ncbi:MAG: hypothetical protein COV67_10510 [Nitrospinae bacterium CG11_big_fil_rev_8_21_14_0_20_56_8]|nr:MAG: hypothetical protein COV67_10510 [Nitrospinae bacterium CG11_big_fil_rev_8_21_14_0_20_56_8]
MHFLSHINIFDGLEDQELSQILALGKESRLKPQEYIFKEYGPGDRFYILKEGQIEITVHNPVNPPPIVLATLAPTEVFGEFCLFDDAPRSATAKATQPSLILEILKKDVFALFQKETRIGMVILQNLGTVLCKRLRNTDKNLRNHLLWSELNTPLP